MMQLTPQQRDQIKQAKESGQTNTTVEFTSEQKDHWQAAVQAELAGKEENIEHHRKIQAVAKQPGFFGDLRRAIVSSRRPTDQLATDIGIEARRLSDFRAGEADLPPFALDRLIETLGLRLMQEIPQ